ncbi:MAG: DUF4235 domain-containing protein [Aeromicrobium sp.]
MSKKTKRKKAADEAVANTAKKKSGGKGTWKMMDRASTIVAGMIAQRVSSAAWHAATGKKPPTNTRHPEVGKAEAITWAVLAGVVVELSKVLIRRWTSDYWVKSTGKLPPGMKPLKTPEAIAAREAKAAADANSGKSEPADPPVEAPAGRKAKRARRT